MATAPIGCSKSPMLNTPQDYENELPALVANGTVTVEGDRPDRLKSKEGLVDPLDIPDGDSSTTTANRSVPSAENARNLQSP